MIPIIPISFLLAYASYHNHRAYLLMHIKFPEDLGGIQEVLVLHNPAHIH
jgi:hypothetical protein